MISTSKSAIRYMSAPFLETLPAKDMPKAQFIVCQLLEIKSHNS